MRIKDASRIYWFMLATAVVLQVILATFIHGDNFSQSNDAATYNAVGFTVMFALSIAAVSACFILKSPLRMLLIAGFCAVFGTVAHQIFGTVTSPNEAKLSTVGLLVAVLLTLIAELFRHDDKLPSARASRAFE